MALIFFIIVPLSFGISNNMLPNDNYCLSDSFGYYWLDSDTNAPNAPIFNWVSIYNRGTRITGLADDNVKGPISLGFNFPFYWEQENSIYVGSNGYISFDDNFLSAFPFQSLPSIKRPNNILAPLMADLDFTVGTASCWYWTNAIDTFIIEFDSVPFWLTGGLNSFQIILCRSDTSITFQYLDVQGEPFGGWFNQNSNSIGIENSTGNIGLQYLRDGMPFSNQIHDSLAIRFFRPAPSSFTMHDVKVLNILNDRSGAIFLCPGDSVRFWAKTKNAGNRFEEMYFVTTNVKDQMSNLVYTEYTQLYCRPPGIVDSVVCTPIWIPSNTGRYTLSVKTALTNDMCLDNDSIVTEMRVITSANEFQYDDEPTCYLSWNRAGGFANHFIPSRYPTCISGAKIYASSSRPVNISVNVYNDNGPNQSPGDILASATLNISLPNWYIVTFSQPVLINSGSFYVGTISPYYDSPLYGIDTVPPFSHRLWEYSGAGNWVYSRYNFDCDICIRAVTTLGVEELSVETPVTSQEFIFPNPFSKNTEIRFSNPLRQNKILYIYNASGVLVRVLTTQDEKVIWDGKNDAGLCLPSGCYFIRVADNRKSLHKVIIAR